MVARIVELAAGPARLRLAPELGGRITALALAAGGEGPALAILHPFPEGTTPGALLHWPKGGIYPLIPYGNRIRDARLRLPDGERRLRSHPDAAPHTLHGHAHRVPWSLERCDPTTAVLALSHPGDEEWPWRFVARQSVTLRPDGVTIALAVTHADGMAMPAGIGLHPYLRHAAEDRLAFRAATDWPTTPEVLAGHPVPSDGAFAAPRPLPAGGLTLYRGGWDGRCTVTGAAGVLELRADSVFGHLVVHRPADPAYLCLEPCSHAPDGFNLAQDGVPGAGRVLLAPGETLAGEVSLTLRPRTSAP